MAARAANILHVVSRDTPRERFDRLRALCAAGESLGRQRVLCVDNAESPCDLPVPVLRVRRNRIAEHLGALDAAIREAVPPGTLLHVWSLATLRQWCAAGRCLELPPDVDARECPVLVDVDETLDRAPLAPIIDAYFEPTFVAATEHIAGVLSRAGVPEHRLTLIREAVNPLQADRAPIREHMRESLRLSPDDEAVLVLPPITRAGGAFHALWSVMLAQKVRPRLRVILPGATPEADRAARLAKSIFHEHLVRRTNDRYDLDHLMLAAELAIFTPDTDAAVTAIIRAQHAALPIVAADVPAVRELLQHEHNARLARPQNQKDAARQIVLAFERPGESMDFAARGRAAAQSFVGVDRMLKQYAELYARLREPTPSTP